MRAPGAESLYFSFPPVQPRNAEAIKLEQNGSKLSVIPTHPFPSSVSDRTHAVWAGWPTDVYPTTPLINHIVWRVAGRGTVVFKLSTTVVDRDPRRHRKRKEIPFFIISHNWNYQPSVSAGPFTFVSNKGRYLRKGCETLGRKVEHMQRSQQVAEETTSAYGRVGYCARGARCENSRGQVTNGLWKMINYYVNGARSRGLI